MNRSSYCSFMDRFIVGKPELMFCASDFNWSNPPQSDSDFSSRIYYGRRAFVYHLAWHSRWLDFELTRFGWRYDGDRRVTARFSVRSAVMSMWCERTVGCCASLTVRVLVRLHIWILVTQLIINITARWGANSFALANNYLKIWAISRGREHFNGTN